MLRISYSSIEGTNLYKVTLHALNQTIVDSHGFLSNSMGMYPDVLVGCKDLSISAIIDLGFVFPPVDRKLVI